jgi:hypothetical protein
MILNYQHKDVNKIIQCELDYYPADPENGFMDDSMELVSATVKGVDILAVMCDSVIKEIQDMALNKDATNTD